MEIKITSWSKHTKIKIVDVDGWEHIVKLTNNDLIKLSEFIRKHLEAHKQYD